MIGLLLPLWLNLGGGGSPPVTPVPARVRQSFAPALVVTQEFDTTVETTQSVAEVISVVQEFEVPP